MESTNPLRTSVGAAENKTYDDREKKSSREQGPIMMID